MPSYIVRNENFRDEVIKYSYPFDEQSTLEDEELYIGTDLFLDAVFYLKEPAELPISIGVVDGTYGELEEVLFIFTDASGVEIGRAPAGFDSTEVTVLSPRGVPVGCVVLHPEGLARFIGRVSGKVFSILSSVATFLLDVCHVVNAPQLRYFIVDGEAVHGDVEIVARHGCVFVVDENGEIRLDIIGDLPTLNLGRNPVLSVNGVRNQSIWLAGHPRGNLRIINEDGVIRFAQAKDIT